MGLNRAKINVFAGLCFWKLQGRIYFLAHSGHWQNLVAYHHRTELPAFLPAVCWRPFPASRGHRHGLWPCLSIFRTSNGGWILLIFKISPLLVSDPDGKVLLLLRTPVFTLGPPRWSQTTSPSQGPYSIYIFRVSRDVGCRHLQGKGVYSAYRITIFPFLQLFPPFFQVPGFWTKESIWFRKNLNPNPRRETQCPGQSPDISS